MGKGRASDKIQRAMQQKIAAGMDIVTRVGGEAPPSKAELRASIPAYDESMVKKIDPKVKGKKQATTR